jgi:chromate transporter
VTSEFATPTPSPGSRAARAHVTLADLFRQSLWMGIIGFGGGMSVLGAIHHLAVEKRRWLTEREFANTATVAQMLPGGAASNALAHIGLRFRGIVGAVVGYTGFIVPGAAITLALAWVYVRFGVTPRFEAVLAGFNAGVVGIIGALALQMVRTAVARAWQMAVATGALLLSVGGGAASGEIALLGIASGLVIDLVVKRARLARVRRVPRKRSPPVALPDEGQPLERLDATRAPPAPDEPPLARAAFPFPLIVSKLGVGGLLALGLLFFRTGLGAYGGGFAIIPHLHATVVGGGWISERQFADAVAVGKLTPGPVLLMATFIGYVARGLPGALLATFTIFAAPFILVVTLGTWLLRMRSRRSVRAALRGLTPAVVGLMAAAAVTLGATLQRPVEFGIAVATALTLSRFRVNPVLVLLLAGGIRWGLAATTGM